MTKESPHEHPAHNTPGRTARVSHPALSPPATDFAHALSRRLGPLLPLSAVRRASRFSVVKTVTQR